MKKIKVAIIGVGHLGSRHLKVLSQLKNKVELVGISDIDSEKAARLAREFGTRFFPDYRTLAGMAEAVTICTPTISHCDVGLFFINNGLHTFIEKPIAMTTDEADKLIEAARAQNVKLQIGHVERFNSAFTAIKDIAKNPLFIECHRLNNFPNRSLDIGVTLDLMIHDIDIVLGLIDSPLKNIAAIGINVLTDKDDISNVRLTFDNKSVCNLTASRISPEVMRKIRIFIPDAYISLDYVKQEAFIYRKEGTKINRTALPIEKEEPLKKELEHFIDCVRDDKRPLVAGEEGREALKTALAIQDIIWRDYVSK
ncbi:MAG: Gfo/Idh/MocA family oxidoreductase [Candidatus Omnitrophica bacterium]|nr:Gfo/Idh/MocA family oxidoreductase [Candidatus Omnitrophota bacterium]